MRQTTLIVIAASYLTVALAVARADPDGPPPLKVVGKELKTPDGKVVRLRGINIPSMAWGHGDNLWKSLDVARDWGTNLIRFPLSQDHWFRPTRGKWDAQLYRERVRMFVDKAAAKECYVLLDLHSSDAGAWGKNIGYHNMPDENSIPFWDDLARTYANPPAILF
jgi:aryl-phospho-beta-D-glucosidase BglC (GH1 family)